MFAGLPLTMVAAHSLPAGLVLSSDGGRRMERLGALRAAAGGHADRRLVHCKLVDSAVDPRAGTPFKVRCCGNHRKHRMRSGA